MIPISRCYLCGCLMSLPEELYLAATKSQEIVFYCAYGHPQCFNEILKEVPVEDDPEPGEKDNVVPIR